MSVSSISWWKVLPGKMNELVEFGRRAKAVVARHGGEEFRMAHGYSGAVTGEVLAVIKCADWESFGKMMQSMSADSEYQDILSGIVSTGTAELASRSVVVSIDL